MEEKLERIAVVGMPAKSRHPEMLLRNAPAKIARAINPHRLFCAATIILKASSTLSRIFAVRLRYFAARLPRRRGAGVFEGGDKR
jgi:hypothetical protein